VSNGHEHIEIEWDGKNSPSLPQVIVAGHSITVQSRKNETKKKHKKNDCLLSTETQSVINIQPGDKGRNTIWKTIGEVRLSRADPLK
jgi:hypothetical protein